MIFLHLMGQLQVKLLYSAPAPRVGLPRRDHQDGCLIDSVTDLPAGVATVRRWLLALALALALGLLVASTAAGRAPSQSGSDHVYYMPLASNVPPAGLIYGAITTDSGLQRDYLLYVPTTYTGRNPVPLIFNYHAYARNALHQLAYGDFRPLAERDGAILVLPQGAMLNGLRRWNVGGYYTHPTADDVGFTGALIDALSATYNIDPDRIYSAGFSNGAMMSYLVACQLSQRFAAVAVVAGSLTPEMRDTCSPARPLAVLHIHGLDDDVVPYGGDGQSVAVDEAIAYWVAANHNHPAPVVRPRPDSDPTDGSTVTHFIFEDGENGVTTELLQIDGGGHAWPGAADSGPADSGPGTNYDIDASAEIWDFFARYDINGRRTTSNQQPTTSNQPPIPSNRRSHHEPGFE